MPFLSLFPLRNARSVAPPTPYTAGMVQWLMVSAYPSRVLEAVMCTLSCPVTGLSPGAVLNVTFPACLSTVKSVFSTLATHSPSLFSTSAVTGSLSSPSVVNWYTVASFVPRKLSVHFFPMRFSP